jgi:hypothetical protein
VSDILCKDSEVDPILNSIHNPMIRTRIQKRENPDLVKIWSRFLGKSNTAKPWGMVLLRHAMDNAAGWGMALLVQASGEQLYCRVDCPVSRVSQIKGARLRRVKGAGVRLSGGWCWAKMVTVGCSMRGKEVGCGKERKERGRVGRKERIVPWPT